MEELSEHLAEAASEADEAADSNERILSDTRFRTLDRLQVTIEAGRRAAPEVYAAMEAHGAALEAGDQEAAAEAAESYFRALDSLDGQDAQLVDRALDAGDEYRETSFRLRDEIRAIEANNEVIAEVQERTEPIRQELETRVRRLEGAHAQLLYSAAEDAGIDVDDLDLSDAQLADNLQALGNGTRELAWGMRSSTWRSEATIPTSSLRRRSPAWRDWKRSGSPRSTGNGPWTTCGTRERTSRD